MDVTDWTVAQCRKKQTTLRRAITTSYTRVVNIVANKWDVIDAEELVEELRLTRSDLKILHERLSEIMEEGADWEDQENSHANYCSKVDETGGLVSQYRASIVTAQLAAAQTVNPTNGGAGVPKPPTETEEERKAREALEAARKRFEDLKEEMQQAAQDSEALGDPRPGWSEDEDDSLSSVSHPRSAQPVKSFLPPRSGLPRASPQFSVAVHGEDAPDEWIELYYLGKEPPHHYSKSNRHSSVRAELDLFCGLSVEWFTYIEMFYHLVHHTDKAPGEKLSLLKKSLKGDCAHVVHGLGGGEAAYKEALKRLKEEYGNREVMKAAYLQSLDLLVPPRDQSGFKKYAEAVRTHLFELTRIGETGHASIIDRVAQKLSFNDRLAWNEGKHGRLEFRPMNHFGAWLCSRASAYQNACTIAANQIIGASKPQPHHSKHFTTRPSSHHPSEVGRKHARTNHGSSRPTKEKKATDIEDKRPPVCFKCEADHRLESCPKFKELSVADRVEFCKLRALCFCCFGVRHSQKRCHFKKTCTVPDCQSTHHPLMHDPDFKTAKAHAARNGSCKVALGVLQLAAIAENGEVVPVNVMIDEGSDSTLIRAGLARRLKVSGPPQTLRVDGVGTSSIAYESERVQLQLKTEDGNVVSVEGSTLPQVTKPVPLVDWSTLKQRWAHLSNLPLRSSGGKVDILLGLDYAHLVAVIESRVGVAGEPIASLTPLGWIVRGVFGGDLNPSTARVHKTNATAEIGPQLLSEMRRFCDTESFGTEYQKDAMSPSDQAAVKMLEAGLKKLPDGSYEAPVLWKNGEPPPDYLLPNNQKLAEHRLNSLLSKFKRESPDYEKKYRAAMQKNFDQGFARRMTEEEVKAGKAKYFLPHFSTFKKHSKKKEIRLVFDGAARFKGQCLNEHILPGPKLQNPLPGVILGFREKQYAWATDIKSMYSKIHIPTSDQEYHCFLWPEEDGSISVCRMLRVTFGINCSPYVAIRVTWKAAEDAGVQFTEAAEAIKKKMYIDDMMDSEHTLEKAIERAKAVTKVLNDGDFKLDGWKSNSPEFLTAVCPDQVAERGANKEEIDLSGEDEDHMVLGLTYNPGDDTLGFRLSGLDDVEYTRVGLVSKVASHFDPQGTAAPLTVKAKIKLRELGQKGLDWYDRVAEKDKEWWKSYFSSLKQLKEVRVKRCLFPDAENIMRSEMHTFGDASEEAYCAVVYIRNVYRDGGIEVHQVKAATKLAPTKTISVCKLELCAALLGSRLARFVERSLSVTVDARYFWTDSSTVRNWIRAISANYQVFVSHRTGEIQTLTEATEWRFIPGKLNPADAATRSLLTEESIPQCWLSGPEFLHLTEETWPKDIPWIVVNEEIRKCRVQTATTQPQPTVSSWWNVRVSVSDLPVLNKLDGPYQNHIKRCQQEAFGEDIARLKKKKALLPSSRLRALTPFLDENEVLRLGGRLGRAKLPYDTLHPPILPGKHELTRKIITAFHESLHHLGTDFVLTQIRQYFWLTNGREAVKRVKRDCAKCRRYRPKAASQLMADVHEARLDAGTPPFTHTAVDYFGPFEVTHGRGTAKRWGVLFTCLVTRALYLDVAVSLSADDFLNVYRRLIAMFRKPDTMHSDNGTNFVGAEKQLRKDLEQMVANGELEEEMKKRGVKWFFQPARTPHFGGSHEALVHSTKKALYAALDSEKGGLRVPSDDMLRTLLCEVAGLLNSRPLTYASSDPDDLRPLTPNDFLNKASVADLPAGDFQKALPRDHYRYIQKILNLFWDLWKGAYFQSMASRKKWQTRQRNLAVGDYVLENWKTAPRGQWKTGSIVKTYPGNDGLVRAVDVQLPTGVFRRGTAELCLLEPVSNGRPISDQPSSGEDGAAKE